VVKKTTTTRYRPRRSDFAWNRSR